MPRTARMIGLALSYDGAERITYTTEAGAWAMLMPEAEMVTVMHNAKFDLSVLRRTGLDVETRLKERGYVKNWFGRRRRLSGRTKREIRQASNFLIQGTGADIAKAAMAPFHAALPEGARLISIVHDEFIVECRVLSGSHYGVNPMRRSMSGNRGSERSSL